MNVILVDPSQRVYNAFMQLRELYPWQILRRAASIAEVKNHISQVHPTFILLVSPEINVQNQGEIEKWMAQGIQVAAFGAGGEYPLASVIPFPKIELNSEQGILGTLKVLAPGLKRRLLSQGISQTQPRMSCDISQSTHSTDLEIGPELILIGISTGGPSALGRILERLPHDFKTPIVIVQHIPVTFAETMASNLSTRTHRPVEVIENQTLIQRDRVYLAPGGSHVTLHRVNGKIIAKLNHDEPVNSCRPSVDVLFKSAAQNLGGKMVAAIMTGMGADGCEGAAALKHKGAMILAQDEESSTVWGMPKAVIDAGLADQILSLDEFAPKFKALQGVRF